MIGNVSILNVDPDRAKAVLFCQLSRKKAYLCLVVKHEMKGNPYWCIYVGLTRTEYVTMYKTEEVRMDQFSFIGIAGDVISIQAKTADLAVVDQPEYFVGVHIWGSEVPDSSGEWIMSQVLKTCTEVDEILARENAE